MNHTNLSSLRDGLAKEDKALTEAVIKAREQLQGFECDLRKVKAALAALDGDASKGKEKGLTQRRPAPSLPAAGRSQIIKLIETLLATAGALPVDDLKRRVEELASQQGFTRRGIALRMKEALCDAKFLQGPDGVALRHASSITQVEPEVIRLKG